MSPDPHPTPTTHPAPTQRPVFVDSTGRRRRLLALVAWLATVWVLTVVVTTALGVRGDEAPARWQPGPGSVTHPLDGRR